MDILHWFQNNFIHLDKTFAHIVALYGIWVYAILFAIIFCETGLVITPFLPGDALLFAVGAFAAARPDGGINYSVIVTLLSVAAILGNLVNFKLGGTIGSRIFKEEAIVLKKVYLTRAHIFFEKHGARAVILARFLPIFRTLVPFVAGVAAMSPKKFTLYTITGSLIWVFLMTTSGLFFGSMPWVQKHFEIVVIGIIFISMLPVAYEAAIHYFEARSKK
ncbi:MAG: VTT domain-containing protein [Chthoniobacterales bacterium]